MAYWWVNQGRNFARESSEGYLWAPLTTPNGGRRPDWTNMGRLQPNDIVFNYSSKMLRGFCVITAEATPWPTPYPDGYGEAREGTMALAQYHEALVPISYKGLRSTPPHGLGISLAGALPKLELPDKPALGYLFELPGDAAEGLWKAVGSPTFVFPDPQLPPIPKGGTSKLRLAAARVGQGEFGRGVREAFSHKCSVTGLRRPEAFILHAAHIKPWSASDDQEKLDPSNGILLHATLHHAFDAGLIDFGEDGVVFTSPRLSESERRLLGIPDSARLPTHVLTPRRRTYLRHRWALRRAEPIVK